MSSMGKVGAACKVLVCAATLLCAGCTDVYVALDDAGPPSEDASHHDATDSGDRDAAMQDASDDADGGSVHDSGITQDGGNADGGQPSEECTLGGEGGCPDGGACRLTYSDPVNCDETYCLLDRPACTDEHEPCEDAGTCPSISQCMRWPSSTSDARCWVYCSLDGCEPGEPCDCPSDSYECWDTLDLRTPDSPSADRFVLPDGVGVCLP